MSITLLTGRVNYIMNDKKNNKKDSAYNQDVTTNYQDTFYIIPRHIRHLEGMTLTYLDFYETCYQFWNKGRSCYLSNSIIKQRTGIKSDSRINEAFQYFEKHNVLKREYKNGRRYITPILCEVETDEGVSPEREGGIAVARGGVSPERDINKEIINKENNNYVIIKENEFEEVIQKAQKCLEKTKENLPATSNEIVPYEYQETNLPTLKKSTTLQQLQEINSLGLPCEFLEQLISIRKTNKASVNKKAMQAVYQELIKLKESGLDLDECLNIYANCGWKGFFAEWFINLKKKKQSTHLDHDSTEWGKQFETNPFFQNLDWIK
jgi:hypothetical protein